MEQEYELIADMVTGFRCFLVNTFYRTPHLHRELEICYVLEGALRVTTSDQTELFQRGDFYIINSWQTHDSQALSDNERTLVLVLQLSPRMLQDCFPEIAGINFSFQIHNRDSLHAFDQIIALLLVGAQHFFSHSPSDMLKAKGTFLLFFGALIDHCYYNMNSSGDTLFKKNHQAKMLSITAYIEDNYVNLSSSVQLRNTQRSERQQRFPEPEVVILIRTAPRQPPRSGCLGRLSGKCYTGKSTGLVEACLIPIAVGGSSTAFSRRSVKTGGNRNVSPDFVSCVS